MIVFDASAGKVTTGEEVQLQASGKIQNCYNNLLYVRGSLCSFDPV